nr:MAG TPA: hypothetical protein [Caudoviricetes sp.]
MSFSQCTDDIEEILFDYLKLSLLALLIEFLSILRQSINSSLTISV